MAVEHNGREVVVALVGHYGNRNLGDESIVTATLAGLRRHIPGVVPIAVSMDPADSARRHGVDAFPVRRTARSPATTAATVTTADPVAPEIPDVVSAPAERKRFARLLRPIRAVARRLRAVGSELVFLVRVWRFVRRADLVMITGSNQFLDNFGGPAGYPWTLFKWSLMARLAGTPVAFVSVGAGPIERRSSRLLAGIALRLAVYVSWRDPASRALMARRGGREVGHVYPDLAFSLRFDVGERRDSVLHVGINPMPVYDGRYWPDARAECYARYVATLAEAIVRLRGLGWQPFLYAMHPGDERVIEDISAALRHTGSGAPVPTHAPASLDALLDLLRSADLLVPTRFHGTVLGLACGRPVLSLSYHRKTSDLMRRLGLGAGPISLEGLDVDQLVDQVKALAMQVPAIHGRIDRALEAKRVRLDEQYVRIASLLAHGGRDLNQMEMEPS